MARPLWYNYALITLLPDPAFKINYMHQSPEEDPIWRTFFTARHFLFNIQTTETLIVYYQQLIKIFIGILKAQSEGENIDPDVIHELSSILKLTREMRVQQGRVLAPFNFQTKEELFFRYQEFSEIYTALAKQQCVNRQIVSSLPHELTTTLKIIRAMGREIGLILLAPPIYPVPSPIPAKGISRAFSLVQYHLYSQIEAQPTNNSRPVDGIPLPTQASTVETGKKPNPYK